MGVGIIGSKLFLLKDTQHLLELEPFLTSMVIDDGGGVTFNVNFIADKSKSIEGTYSLHQESFGRYNERIIINSPNCKELDIDKIKKNAMDVLNNNWSPELKRILSLYAVMVLDMKKVQITHTYHAKTYTEYDCLRKETMNWYSLNEAVDSKDVRFSQMQDFTFGKGFQKIEFNKDPLLLKEEASELNNNDELEL